MRVPFLLLAALLAAASTAAAESEPLLRLDGREETYGLLCCPQHAIGCYGVELLADGTLRGAISGWPGTLDPAGAPTFQFVAGRVGEARMRRIRGLLGEAKFGFQRDCLLSPRLAFLYFASASAAPVQSLTWFGRLGRRNRFDLDAGAQCAVPVAEVVAELRDAFRLGLESGATGAR